MHAGNHMLYYDPVLTLTYFKGHTKGVFVDANKNLGIGNDRYTIIDIDHDDKEPTVEAITKDIAPEWNTDIYNAFPGRNKTREK